MLTTKLSSTNYLLWQSQIYPLLIGKGLMNLIDGTRSAPCTDVITDGKSAPNPTYHSWLVDDQTLVSLIFSSLTEEAISVVVGCTIAQSVWLALENHFSHQSKPREFHLKDQLQSLKKGDKSVSEFGRDFKLICDQLSAIGCLVDDTDKIHLYLKGLGCCLFQLFRQHRWLCLFQLFGNTDGYVSAAILH
ncbi:hypothetical protein F511_02512 [Dorcoceras hygrometricum]|nr:hypothetical protein F511_02512 [Dorcoceras hygrometricum]